MNSMVERVARAIFDFVVHDDAVDFRVEDWAPAARAIISDMREPTPEMIEAAKAAGARNSGHRYWRAMIDRCLK